jgi:hypothetical protein
MPCGAVSGIDLDQMDKVFRESGDGVAMRGQRLLSARQSVGVADKKSGASGAAEGMGRSPRERRKREETRRTSQAGICRATQVAALIWIKCAKFFEDR